MTVASLHTVGHGCRVPLMYKFNPCDSKGFTHTDTHNTHSDIGFQLTQFPGKMAMEPQGERVSALEMFNTMFTCLQWRASRGARRTTEERFKGGSMRTTMNQKAEKGG